MKKILNQKQFYNRNSNLPKDKFFWFLSIILIAWSIAYLTRGFYHLLFTNEPPIDLSARWHEQQYILRGSYPYHARPGTSHVIEELGAVLSGGYPPWSFFIGFFLFPPFFSLDITRFYFGLINVLSLVVLGIFSYRVVSPCSRTKALFAVVSTLAISSNCTVLRAGQYGLVVNMFLICVYWLIEYKKFSWAGLFLGLSLSKPNISAFYLFIFLIKRKTATVLVCFIFLLLASSSIWLVTKVDIVEMIVELFRQFDFYALQGTFLINLLPFHTQLTPTSFIVIFGALGTLSVLLLFYSFRESSLLTLFAIACVIGRVFTYHRVYDNVMLVFLLLAFLRLTYQNANRLNLVIFFLLGLSLWLPSLLSALETSYWTNFQTIIWLTALVYLCIDECRPKRDSKVIGSERTQAFPRSSSL